MKNYKKLRTVSFFVSVVVLAGFVLAFSLTARRSFNTETPDSSPQQTVRSDPSLPEDYTNYSDNVGGVSFTEDQITELVRNVYSLDGIVSNLTVDFSENGEIFIEGKIKNVNKLCELYPELDSYSPLLKTVENKKISITGALTDNNGMADFKIVSASVGSLDLNANLLVPFMQEGTFSDIFDVSFDSIEIFNDSVIFKADLPAVLQY